VLSSNYREQLKVWYAVQITDFFFIDTLAIISALDFVVKIYSRGGVFLDIGELISVISYFLLIQSI
jgi:hypothetical protein